MKLKHKNLYYVGGVVRDEILGLPSFDTDFCFEGNAIEFARLEKLNVIKENPAFGTVRVIYEDKEIDIASTRTETYPKKGHLPQVENIGCDLKDDLKRRDFTINAMAKNTDTGEITDYFNGLDDIKNKILRVLHNQSFIDDPTRIIRGLKFSVRFGFELDRETKSLQEEYLNNVNYDMSYHRVKKELLETFNLNKQEAFEKFIDEKIYLLLGKNNEFIRPKTSIQEIIQNSNLNYPYMIYLGCFNLENLPLIRAEKRILEWKERLNTQKATNNTPKESIILHELEESNV